MQRIPFPDPATLPPAMRAVVEANHSNVTRMLAGVPWVVEYVPGAKTVVTFQPDPAVTTKSSAA